MTRKKKRKIKQLTAKEASFGVHFEDEEDANRLLQEYLEKESSEDLLKAKGVVEEIKENTTARKLARNKQSKVTVDLHGLTLQEAKSYLDVKIASAFQMDLSEIEFMIITGKGRHSDEAYGILAHEIHDYVVFKYRSRLIQIEESPSKVKVNGLPIRGHFKVILSR
ncbi:MAG: Smr/MutS family protein [Bdellovibrionota bacterium]